jgi:dCMP deaminase
MLVNKQNHILATGYNGVPAGMPHCIDEPCAGANYPSGTGLNLCQAIHAEQNALLQCRNINEVYTAYVTASPCVNCLRLLLNTSCERIVFAEEYPHPESQQMWARMGRHWHHFVKPTQMYPTTYD